MNNIKVQELTGLIEKTRGLIGQETIHLIYFKTRWGIHTFGVKKPIDVLILDNNMRVVKIKKNLKPNRLFFWDPRFRHVIETPHQFIDKNNIDVGDTISLVA